MPSPAAAPLARRLMLLAARLQRWTAAATEQEPGSLTERQAQLLRSVGDTPRISDVVAALHTTPSVVTGLLDRLERQGLVRRVPSHQDRRAVLVELTAAGRVRRDQGTEAQVAALAAAFASLSDDDLAVVVDCLALLERLVAPSAAVHPEVPGHT